MRDQIDDPVTRAIGTELRQARDAAGWTRDELVARLPSDLHPQTLATYERGIRQCTLGRFIVICRTLGVSAPDLPKSAIQRAGTDPETITTHIEPPIRTRHLHTPSTRTDLPGMTDRISVNITPHTLAALDMVKDHEKVSTTEALRRLVGYGELVYRSITIDGSDILIRNGCQIERIVLERPVGPDVGDDDHSDRPAVV